MVTDDAPEFVKDLPMPEGFTRSDRGFKYSAWVHDNRGGKVQASESSAVAVDDEEAWIWLRLDTITRDSTFDSGRVKTAVHLSLDQVEELIQDLQYLVDTHYQGRPANLADEDDWEVTTFEPEPRTMTRDLDSGPAPRPGESYVEFLSDPDNPIPPSEREVYPRVEAGPPRLAPSGDQRLPIILTDGSYLIPHANGGYGPVCPPPAPPEVYAWARSRAYPGPGYRVDPPVVDDPAVKDNPPSQPDPLKQVNWKLIKSCEDRIQTLMRWEERAKRRFFTKTEQLVYRTLISKEQDIIIEHLWKLVDQGGRR